MPTLNNDDYFEVSALIYRKWAEELDLVKKVRQEKNDGSRDWLLFHAERMKVHMASEAKWKALLDRMIKQNQ